MSQTHKPLTDSEEQTLRENIPHFLIGTQTNTGRKLHIPNGETPLCASTIQRRQKDDWIEKPTATYPLGYRDVCLHCSAIWRENNAD